MSALTFFVGKGGVGKTTLSSAYAAYRSRLHPRRHVLLLSTDPAHSLADIFQVHLGPKPRRITTSSGSKLTIWQIDAQLQFRRFLDVYREPIVSLLEGGTMFTRAEIEPLLDTTLPGMAEMAALLAIHEALENARYSEIVVDTAPIGHTLRLFQMPEYFERFLDLLDLAASRDQVLAERFGGGSVARNPFIAEWRRMVQTVQEALHQRESRVVMVTSPEGFSLNESLRTADVMATASDPLHVTEITLNRAFRSGNRCAACKVHAFETKKALRFLRQHFRRVPVHIAEDIGAPILGAVSLSAFGEHVFAHKPLRLAVAAPERSPELKLKRVSWPTLDARITWTAGKGGVGKTTISAALAMNQRQHARASKVMICSTDPAPSLDDVFQKKIADKPVSVAGDSKLLAAELDASAAFREWADEMKAKVNRGFSSDDRGVHVDLSFERRILTALLDLVPPGVDEISAIFRILDWASAGQWLIIDMAPTGHALELLRMPERILLWSRLLLKSLAPHRRMSLARDVAVQIATLSQRVRELAGMLKSREAGGSHVIPVMLAEPLPDRETVRLLDSLEDMGISTPELFVNRVLFAQDVRNCRRCQLARTWQLATVSSIRRQYREKNIYLVRNRAREIAGTSELKSFIRELWQIV